MLAGAAKLCLMLEQNFRSPWNGSQTPEIVVARRHPSIVNQVLTRIAEYEPGGLRFAVRDEHEAIMQRLRLKADGRIVELRDGQEFPLSPAMVAPPRSVTGSAPAGPSDAPLPAVRDLRRRACLTQMEFASRLGVPVETIRNWEQGKRMPRGPARALLAAIARAPDAVFSALAKP